MQMEDWTDEQININNRILLKSATSSTGYNKLHNSDPLRPLVQAIRERDD